MISPLIHTQKPPGFIFLCHWACSARHCGSQRMCTVLWARYLESKNISLASPRLTDKWYYRGIMFLRGLMRPRRNDTDSTFLTGNSYYHRCVNTPKQMLGWHHFCVFYGILSIACQPVLLDLYWRNIFRDQWNASESPKSSETSQKHLPPDSEASWTGP